MLEEEDEENPRLKALTRESIFAALDDVCHQVNAAGVLLQTDTTTTTTTMSSSSSSSSSWIFEPKKDATSTRTANADGETLHPNHDDNFFGLIARNGKLFSEQEQQQQQHVTYFYLAYSTWDGRVLFRDQQQEPPPISAAMTEAEKITAAADVEEESLLFVQWFQVLARVAVALGCTRFVWNCSIELFPPMLLPVPHETLPAWLTLTWSLSSMQLFVTETDAEDGSLSRKGGRGEGVLQDEEATLLTLQQPQQQRQQKPKQYEKNMHATSSSSNHGTSSQPSVSSSSSSSSLRQRVTAALSIIMEKEKQQRPQNHGFSVRLASSQHDVQHHVVRLVHGLALFEKEPDSVHIGLEQYSVDGGFPLLDKNRGGDNDNEDTADDDAFAATVCAKNDTMPLYYCLLLEYHGRTCGMAFLYFGYTAAVAGSSGSSGRFLYLEDLFLEEPYRGKGGGTFAMKTLACLALALDCTHMKWQALDWNTPALEFYNKLGAHVQTGLGTCRFTGTSLLTMATSPIVSSL